MTILDRLNLDRGSHKSPNDGVCVMEVLSLAMGADFVNGEWRMRDGMSFTDLPGCTMEVIARVAQWTWDAATTDDERVRLLARFLPRLLRAEETNNRRVHVRVALAAARHVEHLAGPEAKACNGTVEAWLRGEATDEQVREARLAAYAAYAADDAAYAASAYAAAAYAAYAAAAYAAYAAYASATASAAYAAAADDALQDLLDVLLDAHQKACAEEGEMMFDPEPWEADAVDFVDRLMGELDMVLAETA